MKGNFVKLVKQFKGPEKLAAKLTSTKLQLNNKIRVRTGLITFIYINLGDKLTT
jgi:hypothetical protein